MTEKMNPDVKGLWTAALRDGSRAQGVGALCHIGMDGSRSFCCLGVLSELAVEAGVAEYTETSHYREYRGVDDDEGYCFNDLMLTPALHAWSGLPEHEADTLVSMNDGQLLSFAEIADYIDENL